MVCLGAESAGPAELGAQRGEVVGVAQVDEGEGSIAGIEVAGLPFAECEVGDTVVGEFDRLFVA